MPIVTGRTAIGWSILQREQVPLFEVQLSGGTAKFRIRAGDTATILCDLAKRYDATVEPIIGPTLDYWSWALRLVRESDNIWSEHSAGTALDFRALLHLRGVRGTFNEAQVDAIHDLLEFYEGVVDWGGNFHTTVDEMHFEIGARPGDPAIARVAAKIRALEDEMSAEDVKKITAAIAASEGRIADAVYDRLTHRAFTGDEAGDSLDRRPPVQIALVAARNTEKLITGVAALTRLVGVVIAATADDATKAQVQEIGDRIDRLLAGPGQPDVTS